MAPPSNSTRPPLRFEHSSFAALGGLERVIPPSSPPFLYHETCSESELYKPLPPVPSRRPSSVYSNEDIIEYYMDRSPEHDRRTSNTFSFSSSSNFQSRRGRESLPRPRAHREDSNYTVASSIAKLRQLQDSSRNSSRSRSERDVYLQPPSLRATRSLISLSPRSHSPTSNANELADRYEAVLPPTPQDFLSVPSSNGPGFPFPPTSATITQIVDHSLLPPPLHSPSRHSSPRHSPTNLSPASSRPPSPPLQKRHSLSTYARRALHRLSVSREEMEHERIMSLALAKYPYMGSSTNAQSTAQTPERRRSSLQDRLSKVYSTISHLSLTPSSQKRAQSRPPMTIALPLTPRTPLTPGSRSSSHRSPAIPMTPYQSIGTRAWEGEPESPDSPIEGKGPKKDRMSFLGKRRARRKEERREKWREEVKKTIVVLAPSGGGVEEGGWL